MKINLDSFIKSKGRAYKLEYDDYLSKARDCFEQKNVTAFISNIAWAFLIKPKRFEGLDLLSKALARVGKFNLQLVVTKYNLEINPHLLVAHISHASSLISNQKVGEAKSIMRMAAKRFERSYDLNIISTILWKLGDSFGSYQIDNRLLADESISDVETKDIVVRLIKSNMLSGVIAPLKQLVKRGIASEEVKIYVCDAFLHSLELTLAKNLFDSIDSKKLDSDVLARLWLCGAEIYIRLYKPDYAIKLLQKISTSSLDREFEARYYYGLSAIAYRLIGTLDLSKKMYERALQLSNNDFASQIEYISLLEHSGELEDAKLYAQKLNSFFGHSVTTQRIFSRLDRKLNGDFSFQKVKSFSSAYLYETKISSWTRDQGNPVERIASIKKVMKSGVLTETEYFHSIFKMGHLFAEQQKWRIAFDCWAMGGRELRKMFSFDVDKFSQDHFTIQPYHNFKYSSANIKKRSVDEHNISPLICFGLPEHGIEEFLLRANNSDNFHLLEGEESSATILNTLLNESEFFDYFHLIENKRVGEKKIEVQEALLDHFSGKEQAGKITLDFLSYDLRLVSILSSILPSALFCTAVRPRACAVTGMFSQLYTSGNLFTYDFQELCQIYSDYQKNFTQLEKFLSGRLLRLDFADIISGGVALNVAIKRQTVCGSLSKIHPEFLASLSSAFFGENELILKPYLQTTNLEKFLPFN